MFIQSALSLIGNFFRLLAKRSNLSFTISSTNGRVSITIKCNKMLLNAFKASRFFYLYMNMGKAEMSEILIRRRGGNGGLKLQLILYQC